MHTKMFLHGLADKFFHVRGAHTYSYTLPLFSLPAIRHVQALLLSFDFFAAAQVHADVP